jgi:hypothetical protein
MLCLVESNSSALWIVSDLLAAQLRLSLTGVTHHFEVVGLRHLQYCCVVSCTLVAIYKYSVSCV